MHKLVVRSVTILASLAMLVALPMAAQASHSWGPYHWARTANPFAVNVVDSMTTDWDANLGTAISDWHSSTVLDVVREDGTSSNKTRQRCPAVSGKVRACNAAYGNNGWLGLAQIWLSGGHIVQGVAKMNDSYLVSYSETNRQHVICQEIGHSWGLGHQDESGADLNTCMDYSRQLDNAHPNDHDYEQLVTIYKSHLETATAPRKKGSNRNSRAFENANVRAQENWGRKVSESPKGRSAVFLREFGGGLKILTHVTWAR